MDFISVSLQKRDSHKACMHANTHYKCINTNRQQKRKLTVVIIMIIIMIIVMIIINKNKIK